MRCRILDRSKNSMALMKTPKISGIKSAKALAATGMGKYGKEAKVMVAVDTGMGRVGFLPDEKALEDIRQISKIDGITITGIFSHFATSDDRDKTYAYEQLKIFNDFAGKMKLSGIDYGSKIIANSGACVDLPEAWIDGVASSLFLERMISPVFLSILITSRDTSSPT